jgi:hypothetical protein
MQQPSLPAGVLDDAELPEEPEPEIPQARKSGRKPKLPDRFPSRAKVQEKAVAERPAWMTDRSKLS